MKIRHLLLRRQLHRPCAHVGEHMNVHLCHPGQAAIVEISGKASCVSSTRAAGPPRADNARNLPHCSAAAVASFTLIERGSSTPL